MSGPGPGSSVRALLAAASVVSALAIAGWLVWSAQRAAPASAAPVPATGIPRETPVFLHGSKSMPPSFSAPGMEVVDQAAVSGPPPPPAGPDMQEILDRFERGPRPESSAPSTVDPGHEPTTIFSSKSIDPAALAEPVRRSLAPEAPAGPASAPAAE